MNLIRNILLLLGTLSLTACGPSREDFENHCRQTAKAEILKPNEWSRFVDEAVSKKGQFERGPDGYFSLVPEWPCTPILFNNEKQLLENNIVELKLCKKDEIYKKVDLVFYIDPSKKIDEQKSKDSAIATIRNDFYVHGMGGSTTYECIQEAPEYLREM